MSSARSKDVRALVEGSLARRIPSALTPQARLDRPIVPTGIAALDEMLGGGLPVGAITEIVGGASSGRTACAQAFVAQVLQRGRVGAWVDASDSFDAESAAGNGVDLARVLWVRCGGGAEVQAAVSPERAVGAVGAGAPMGGGGGSPHPRSEVRGLPEAVDAFLTKGVDRAARQVKAGTPGAPNVRMGAVDRTEQVPTDRLPSRRRERVLQGPVVAPEARCVEARRRERTAGRVEVCGVRAVEAQRRGGTRVSAWDRLDQALRCTDLLMQAGGFGVMVLDLGGLAAECVNRIPPATWFRFRAAADKARSSFVLLTRHPCAQSSAEMVLEARATMPEEGTVLVSVPFAVEVLRKRFSPVAGNVVSMRKQPQRAEAVRAVWRAPAAWVGGR